MVVHTCLVARWFSVDQKSKAMTFSICRFTKITLQMKGFRKLGLKIYLLFLLSEGQSCTKYKNKLLIRQHFGYCCLYDKNRNVLIQYLAYCIDISAVSNLECCSLFFLSWLNGWQDFKKDPFFSFNGRSWVTSSVNQDIKRNGYMCAVACLYLSCPPQIIASCYNAMLLMSC